MKSWQTKREEKRNVENGRTGGIPDVEKARMAEKILENDGKRSKLKRGKN